MRSPLFLVAMGVSTVVQLGCQHSASAPDQPLDDNPTGGVLFGGGSASFNASRVFGPQVNLSRRADGSWGGILYGQAVDVSVYGERIAGANKKLKVEQPPNGVVINGLWDEQLLRFEVTPDQFVVRTPKIAYTFHKMGEGVYGPGADVKLTGDAAQVHPPSPQFALALVATFLFQGGSSTNYVAPQPSPGKY